ncbi:MAG: tripartite tricarboxylate transporter substrate binding protein [Burkholderiales bacterium]
MKWLLLSHRVVWATLVCFAAVCTTEVAAQSTSYPNRAIRWIVPLPPGGGADIVARTVADRLSKNLGQQVIVDNRAGGGTVIGAELAARSAPDGYTWLLGTATTHAINASLVKKLPYDPVKDFAPVSLVAVLPQVFVAHPSLPANSLKEVIALARRRPGEINFASTGNGSANQLAVEMLKSYAKVNMVHVPYKGASPALIDLLAGNIQFMSTTIPPALPHLKSGRLKAFAVANAKRSALLPDLPTTAEAGAPGVEASSWNGLIVPAGTPKEIIAKLHGEVVAVMNLSEVRERLLGAGVEPLVNTPAEFAAYIDAETARYAKVVRESGARVD